MPLKQYANLVARVECNDFVPLKQWLYTDIVTTPLVVNAKQVHKLGSCLNIS